MNYNCDKCNYATNKKSDYNRHLKAQKHIKNSQIIYNCKKCNTEYKVKSSFYAHQKKCQNFSNNLENNNISEKSISSKAESETEDENFKIQLLKKD